MTRPTNLVVVGLGYVGMPLVLEAASKGMQVTGLDVDARVVLQVNEGRSHIDDIQDAQVLELLAVGFSATTDADVLRQADVIVICVPTPLDAEHRPDLRAVEAAGEQISQRLQPGQLVVLESTSYPGTTEEVLIPILETSGLRSGVDFNVAFSPERIDPGNPHFKLRNTPKVVGGLTLACLDAAKTFYGQLVDTVVPARGLREAELSKLLENTYRHVNIALVNEMARFCFELGIDLWDAIDCAASKPFGFQAFYPGPGVGGHCIPIDPNYLSFRVRSVLGQPFRFVELAQEVNWQMPDYVVLRSQLLLNDAQKSVKGSRILVIGVTYKANISDLRESPSSRIVNLLWTLGAHVEYFDPLAPGFSVNDRLLGSPKTLAEGVAWADLVIVLQHHDGVDLSVLHDAEVTTLDTRGVLRGQSIQRL
ncbi:MAG: nucleotide sugar dehydrogenase [Candidatus Nanopelagicales bacterium]|nr:nucleotide sugar dehydrogenase [Candidatus Nanopelagicales bacterium]